MTEYLHLTSQGGVASVIIIFLFVIGIAFFIFRKMRAKRKATEAMPTISKAEALKEPLTIEEKAKKKTILGTGQYKCMAIRPGQILDFTTIPEPIGEIYQADTSCPNSGGHYIVRELKDGTVIDYDPREVPLIIGETPEDAWRAIDWRSCKRYWSVPISAWKTPATWFAAALVIVVFIWGLTVTGD